MEFLETILLIKTVRWLWRWLSSNEKNRKILDRQLIDEVIDVIHDAMDKNNGD